MTNFALVPQPDLIPGYLVVCPEFAARWKEHCDYWFPDRAGAYNDLGELAHFVVDNYSDGKLDIVIRVFDYSERLLGKKEPQTTELVVLGLLEDIQTIASNRTFGSTVFVQYLGPISRQVWEEIEKTWEGKTSLMDVIRSEHDRDDT